MKKSSSDWQLLLMSYVSILDPDGWNRSNFDESWNELITLKEFQKRTANSTVQPYKNFDDFLNLTEKNL